MPNALDAAIAAAGGQQPAVNALDRAIVAAGAPDVNPATGGSTLQIWNPFGQNFDTGIGLGDSTTRGLEGAGKAYSDTALGIRQRLAEMLGSQQSADDLRQQAKQTRALDAPLMSTTAGKVGNFGGNAAVALPAAFIPGANTAAGATLVGAGLGLVQPTTSNAETAINTGVGAAAGRAGQYIADKVASGVSALRNGGAESLTPGQQEALDIANQLGLKTTPAQRTGSTALAQIESKLQSQPESSGPFNAIRASNDRKIATAAANAIGENADNVSSQVLGSAEARLGTVFDSVADKTPVPLDPQTYGPRIQQVLKDSEGMIGQNGSLAGNGLFKRLDSFINDAGGATREQLRDISSKLGRAAKNNLTTQSGDRELGIAQMKLQNVVEDAIQSTLSPEQQSAYSAARQQYANLMNLTARNTVVNPSSGNVNARALANLLMSKDKGGFTFGKNDSNLYNAARFAQAFPSLVGDSGTATRMPFTLSSIPSRVAGAVGSRWYMNAADMLAGGMPSGVPPSIAKFGLQSDPMAQELARLLMNPDAVAALPTMGAQSAVQGMRLINAPQQ